MNDLDRCIQAIRDYSRESYRLLMRSPMQKLRHPFIVPGAGYTYQLWDWDSWFTDVAVRQIIADNGGAGEEEFLACEKGSILNFLEHTAPDGRMPIVIGAEWPSVFMEGTKNSHKPCLAQHLVFVLQQIDNDLSWVVDKLPRLHDYIDWYRRTSYHAPTGLYVFLDDSAIGVDNDPAIFYRPDGSTASVYLNVLMYKELKAMAYIMDVAGDAAAAQDYREQADRLAAAINEHLYDERNGMYYSADVNLMPVDPNRSLHSGKPRHWDALLMRVDCWSGFMVLWAGIAPPDRAKRVIEENMLDSRTFCGQYGIRSLSRLEKMYANWPSGNPSCWLGPLWGIANYLCVRGLINYGYTDQARELVRTLAGLYGGDIVESGQMHEYYHPDTGEGINGPGFQSWNLLMNNLLAWYDGHPAVQEF